jgi:site-specific DNA-cytosine methylase
MRVLVACEFSGVVRDAFRARGHDAWSCDLLPTEGESRFHLMGDVFYWLPRVRTFDLMIAHPPCTHLAVSGARWFRDKAKEQELALTFVQDLLRVDIERIALENPVSIISSHIRKPDQIIQPWQFGHGEVKATCLWLKNLPKLVPTNVVEGRVPRVHHASPGPDRWKERSRTLQGIADAMADQWGAVKLQENTTPAAKNTIPQSNCTNAAQSQEKTT